MNCDSLESKQIVNQDKCDCERILEIGLILEKLWKFKTSNFVFQVQNECHRRISIDATR